MIKVNKEINLYQLDQELNGKGLIANNDKNLAILEVGLAENNDATEAELKLAIDAHIAIDEAEAKATAKVALSAAKQTAQDKLKALGLNDLEIAAITGA